MKHKRGINLIPEDYSRLVYDRAATFETVPEWYVLKAICAQCAREGFVDRRSLQRRFGSMVLLEELRPKLRCRHCGNTKGNSWLMTKAAR
jgi:hypothetical protein